MADLNQFLNQDLTLDDVNHSSAYGAAAGGGGAGGLSMDQRSQLLNKPRVVGAYQYSRIGRQGPASKARTVDQKTGRAYDPSTESFEDDASYGGNNRESSAIKDDRKVDSSIERRQHFVEPPKRNYDKYA